MSEEEYAFIDAVIARDIKEAVRIAYMIQGEQLRWNL